MDMLISMGFNVVLELLKDKKKLTKFLEVVAKLYVKLEQLRESNPTLAAAIEKKRLKEFGQ